MHFMYTHSVCKQLSKGDVGFGQGVYLCKNAQTPRNEAALKKSLNKCIS